MFQSRYNFNLKNLFLFFSFLFFFVSQLINENNFPCCLYNLVQINQVVCLHPSKLKFKQFSNKLYRSFANAKLLFSLKVHLFFQVSNEAQIFSTAL